MTITPDARNCPGVGDPNNQWAPIETYNYEWHDSDKIKIAIHAGQCRFHWTFCGEHIPLANNLLQMLRFHEGCEFNLHTKKAIRVNGRRVGTGFEIKSTP